MAESRHQTVRTLVGVPEQDEEGGRAYSRLLLAFSHWTIDRTHPFEDGARGIYGQDRLEWGRVRY